MPQRRRRLAALVSLVVCLVPGCEDGKAQGEGAPLEKEARVQREGELNTITLTRAAADRLGLRTAPVERRRIDRLRRLGGEVVVPPGSSSTIAAPFAATVTASTADAMAAGRTVRSGQPLCSLRPILSAEARVTLATSRVEAAGEVDRARVELEAARIAAKRAEELLASQSGSQRDVDETRARLQAAEVALKTAEARTAVLEAVESDAPSAGAAALEIRSPLDGIVMDVQAAPGQVVAAGTPLLTVAALATVWVRVPVYAGDLARLDAQGEARVHALDSPRDASGRAALPVAAPPAADPEATSVDIVYSLDNADGFLRPGERVVVALPSREGEESLVVPWQAVVFDHDGGTWVYEQRGELTFARRRVRLSQVRDGVAAIDAGPAAGSEVVIEGAAELLSTEFGAAK